MAFSRWFPGPYRREAGGAWPARVSCLPVRAQTPVVPTSPPPSRVAPAMCRSVESCRRGGQRSGGRNRGSTLPGRITAVLQQTGDASAQELATVLECSVRSVQMHLKGLMDAGTVIRLASQHRYALAPRITTLE